MEVSEYIALLSVNRVLLTHQELTSIDQSRFDVAQLLMKIFGGFGDHVGGDAIDRTKCIGPMTAHNIQAG